jgi:hypothetical protein
MIRIFLSIPFLFFYAECAGQNLFLDKLKSSTWLSTTKINNQTLLDVKEIGLSSQKTPVDSLKRDMSIWAFSKDKLIIKNYSLANGKENDSVQCGYLFDSAKMRIKIFHYSQDSTFWEFSAVMISTGSYILLTRIKPKNQDK